MKKLIVSAIAILGFCAVSFGQNSVLTSGISSTAKIIAPLTVTQTQSLAFGSIVPAVAAGTVVISTDVAPTRTPSGNITCIGTFGNVKFVVGGEAGTTYAVTLPANVTLTGGGPAMIATLAMSASPTGNAIANTDFYVGASLAVGTRAAQTAGDYSGTFAVTVAYE